MATYSFFNVDGWDAVCAGKITYEFTKNPEMKTGTTTDVVFTPVAGKELVEPYPRMEIPSAGGALAFGGKLVDGVVGIRNFTVPTSLTSPTLVLSRINVIDASTPFTMNGWDTVCAGKCSFAVTANTALAKGVDTVIALTAADGKEFVQPFPSVYYYGADGSKVTVESTGGASTRSISVTIPLDVSDDNLYIESVEVDDKKASARVSYSFTNQVVCVPRPATYTEGETVEFVLTVAEGWRFTKAPDFRYTDSNQQVQRIYGVLADDGSYHIEVTGITVADGSNAVLSALVEEKPIEVGIVYNLSNASCSPSLTTAVIGEPLSITVNADSGCKFESATRPSLSYVKDGVAYSLFGTFDEHSITFALTSLDCDVGSVITVNAEAVAGGVDVFACSVSYDTQHVILSNQPAEIPNGGSLNIIITTADIDKYYFDDDDRCYVEYVNADDETVKVFAVASANPANRYLSVESISLKRDSVITVHAMAHSVYATFDYGNIRKCVANPIYTVYDEAFAEDSHVQTFTAEDGYIFNGEVSFTGESILGNVIRLAAQISTDRKTAQITIPSGLNWKRNSVITANATAIAEERQYSLSTVFVPTDEQVYQISKKRYYTYVDNVPTSPDQIDLGQYILSLRKMFVDVPIDAEQDILLGFFNTGIVAQAFYGISFDVDCGVVEVKGLYQNSLDFNETTVEACLPFVGLKNLAASVVMNRRLHLVYTVNVAMGECAAKIYDDDSGLLLYVFDGFCAHDVPYILEYSLGKQYQIPKGDLTTGNMALFHCVPSINIRERDVVPDEIAFGDDTVIFETLGNLEGFNVVNEVELNGIVCLDSERQLLRDVLAKGVYFNNADEVPSE